MAVKASRYLTHMKRLRDPGEPCSGWWAGPRVSAGGWGRFCCNCLRNSGRTFRLWTPA